jgi:hypothetical protein
MRRAEIPPPIARHALRLARNHNRLTTHLGVHSQPLVDTILAYLRYALKVAQTGRLRSRRA